MSDDDQVIDLGAYLRARETATTESSPLSLSGTDGERRRYVLPLWRMAYLAGARWAAVVREEVGCPADAVVVLDLAEDPARAEPPGGVPRLQDTDRPPTIRTLANGSLVMPLGEGPGGCRWFALVADRAGSTSNLDDARDDLLFLAGECAGLLTLVEDPALNPDDPSDA